MAKVSNSGSRVWLDEFDLSGFLSSLQQEVSVETPVVTCLSDAGPRRVEGNYDHSHEHDGFFDGADDGFDEQIFAVLNANEDHYLTQLFGASSEGSVAYDAVVRLSEQPRRGGQGEAILLNLSAQGSNGLARGQVLRNATVTGTGNGTGRNLGVSTLNQVFAVTMRVFSGTFTSIGLKIQESSDDGAGDAYADVAGLANTFTAPGVIRVTTTAATEAWKRVVVSGFVGTNAVIGVTAGIVAGT